MEWLKSIGRRAEGGEPEAEQRSEIRDQRSEGNGPVRVTVAANSENRGFPAAANQGIRAATGQQILLINNDTLVTPGWLGRLERGKGVGSLFGDLGNCSPRCPNKIHPTPFPFERRWILWETA